MNMRPHTPETLAAEWQCSPQQVRRLIRKGQLRAFKLNGQLTRISAEAAREFEAEPIVPTNEPERQCVYVVRCGEYIKIGMTVQLNARLKALETSNPFEIELITSFDGGRDLECSLHERFAQVRHRLEWFRHEGDLAEWIRLGCPL